MMKLVYQKAKKVPIEQRDEEINDLITTYNKKVDFIDFNYLRPLIDRYLQIEKEVDVWWFFLKKGLTSPADRAYTTYQVETVGGE